MQNFTDRIQSPGTIILDGATGTEMEKRGAEMSNDAWSATSTLTDPHLLLEIHKDYIQAGAEVITTNTFSTAKPLMAACGHPDKFKEVNVKAVEVAKQARDEAEVDHHVWIAGSMTTVMFNSERPSEAVTRANFTEQAEILAESGVDFFMLEMLQDIEQTSYALESAAKVGLPVILGYCSHAEPNGDVFLSRVRREVTFAESLSQLDLTNTPMITIMHTLTTDIMPSLADLRKSWAGPIGVYAHWGKFVMPNWQFNDMISPADYAAEAEKWVEADVKLVGGCCGIGPDHIVELTRRLV